MSPAFPGVVEQVNSAPFDEHDSAAVALGDDGTTVVCWRLGFPGDIQARIYDSTGLPRGPEFLVNTQTADGQYSPEVAIDALGNFVVVWISNNQDGSLGGIYGQRFDRLGVKQGSEFLINVETLGQQAGPEVAMAANGDFVVVWDTGSYSVGPSRISARMFAADATPVTGELFVAQTDLNPLLEADVAVFDAGGFVATWRDWSGPGPGNHSIKARRYDGLGQSLAPEFLANPATVNHTQKPVVFTKPDGSFGFVWLEVGPAYDTEFIVGQLYDPGGLVDGAPLSVYTHPCERGSDFNLGVDSDADGNFVVLWQAFCPDRDLYTQQFLPNGTPMAPPHIQPALEDGFVALDVRSDGRHVQVWAEYLSGIKMLGFDTDCDANLVGDLVDIGNGALLDLNANGTPDDCEPAGLPPLVAVDPVAAISQNTGPIALTSQITRVAGSSVVASLWEKMAGPSKVIFGDVEAADTDVTLDVAGTYTLRLTVTTEHGVGFGDVQVDIPAAVSSYGLSAPASPVEFLTIPRIDDAAVAADYYQAIDPLNLVDDFDKWKAARGFPDTIPSVAVSGGADCCTGAAFFNTGDLGFGRRMIMARTGAEGLYSHYAFSVSNYATVQDAVLDTNVVATVSMDYSPPEGGGAPIAKFYIFQDLNGDGVQERVPSVDLDGNGEKYLPGMCMTCHGGNKPTSEYRFDGDTGASFLPFDMAAFDFSSEQGLRRDDLEAAFKEFNEGVLETGPAPAIYDVIEGWYGGPTLPNDVQDTSYIPTGWQCTPSNPGQYSRADLAELYHEVIAPSCRNCHASRNGLLDFKEASDFIAWNSSPTTGSVAVDVFQTGSMPHAKVTYDAFWNSTLPYKPDILKKAVEFLNQDLDCSAVSAVNPVPGVRGGSEITGVMPNPFNPMTTIRYTMAGGGEVDLRVYDLKGRLVRVLQQGVMAQGQHEVQWRGRDEEGRTVASGSYFVRLEAGGDTSSRVVLLLK